MNPKNRVHKGKSTMPQLPTYKRAVKPPRMNFTERDALIILATYRHRYLTVNEYVALFFTGSLHNRKTAQRRLQLLFHNQFLTRLILPIWPGQGKPPLVYALDEQGANFVANELGVDRAGLGWNPKNDVNVGHTQLEHALGVSRIGVVLEILHQNNKLRLTGFVGERELKSAEMKDKIPFFMQGARIARREPDSYYLISPVEIERNLHFFLEWDTGTMTNTTWEGKVRAYSHFRFIGKAKKIYGTANYRILIPTKSQRRIDNLKSTISRMAKTTGGGDFFWLTTHDQIDLANPENLLQPIWQIATQGGLHSLL